MALIPGSARCCSGGLEGACPKVAGAERCLWAGGAESRGGRSGWDPASGTRPAGAPWSVDLALAPPPPPPERVAVSLPCGLATSLGAAGRQQEQTAGLDPFEVGIVRLVLGLGELEDFFQPRWF